MSARAWFVIGLLVASVAWIALDCWLLDRLWRQGRLPEFDDDPDAPLRRAAWKASEREREHLS